jgi:hypothetical protein
VITRPRQPQAHLTSHPWGAFPDEHELGILVIVNPRDRLRAVGRRVVDQAEPLAQQAAERAVDLVVNAVDINAIVARVDVNQVVNQVDVDAVLNKVDLNAELQRVDLNPLLERLDLNPLLERIDVNLLLEQVDLNELMQHIDINAVLDRVDVNDLVKHIDMDALIEQTDLGAIIAQSTRGVGGEVLDAARSQVVGLDQVIDRWAGRLFRRKEPAPSAPPALLAAQAER